MQDQGDLVGARAAFERALENKTIFARSSQFTQPRMYKTKAFSARPFNALAIFKKFLPPDHPNIKIVQGNLDSLGIKQST